MDWTLQTKKLANVTLESSRKFPYMKTFLSCTDIFLLGTKSSLLT